MERDNEQERILELMNTPVEDLTDEEVVDVLVPTGEQFNRMQITVSTDPFKMDTQMLVMFRLLDEKGIATEDEINALYRRITLEKLRRIMSEAEVHELQSRILDGVNFPIPKDLFKPKPPLNDN